MHGHVCKSVAGLIGLCGTEGGALAFPAAPPPFSFSLGRITRAGAADEESGESGKKRVGGFSFWAAPNAPRGGSGAGGGATSF
mmetsp:Transcript_62536/g.143313  ORF Transcript_62536/g.143313 Transcript_62536/m.143313 type:complete len:83 (-) Transcript_62536:895-1143(-)